MSIVAVPDRSEYYSVVYFQYTTELDALQLPLRVLLICIHRYIRYLASTVFNEHLNLIIVKLGA